MFSFYLSKLGTEAVFESQQSSPGCQLGADKTRTAECCGGKPGAPSRTPGEGHENRYTGASVWTKE